MDKELQNNLEEGFEKLFNTPVILKKQRQNKALKKKFAPEFLNRIDEVIVFNSLTKNVVMSILNKECKELAENLKDVGEYVLKINKAAKSIILEQGFDPKYGARPLRWSLERLIENPVAEMILKKEISEGDVINITATKGELKLSYPFPDC